MRTIIYNGPWYDGEARYTVVIVNRLDHKKSDFYFLGYYNFPGESETQRIKFIEDPESVHYYPWD